MDCGKYVSDAVKIASTSTGAFGNLIGMGRPVVDVLAKALESFVQFKGKCTLNDIAFGSIRADPGDCVATYPHRVFSISLDRGTAGQLSKVSV